jgi:hypothetical protein
LAESVEEAFKNAATIAARLPDAAVARGLKDGLGID